MFIAATNNDNHTRKKTTTTTTMKISELNKEKINMAHMDDA